jgi:hypothetical protein
MSFYSLWILFLLYGGPGSSLSLNATQYGFLPPRLRSVFINHSNDSSNTAV